MLIANDSIVGEISKATKDICFQSDGIGFDLFDSETPFNRIISSMVHHLLGIVQQYPIDDKP